MKKPIFTALITLILAFLPANAQTNVEYNYFRVENTIAQPVKIETNLGTFTFSNSFTLKGHISHLVAYDANGNKIVNTQPQSKSLHFGNDKPDEFWYVFSTVYGSSSGSSSSQGQSQPTFSYSGPNPVEALGTALMNSIDDDYLTRIYAGVGYGSQFGGSFGANLRTKVLCGALDLSLGIGKSTSEYPYATTFSDKVNWYAGLGISYLNYNILQMGWINRYDPSKGMIIRGLHFATDYSIRFYRDWGVVAGIGMTLDRSTSKTFFEWSIGLTYDLFID